MSDAKHRRPRGPDAVKRALVDACERLCAKRLPSSVTVRAVATEAHVTTGLVHHYFESKDALLVATTRAIAADVTAAAIAAIDDTSDIGAGVRAAWRIVEERPAFRSIILWWTVEGRDVTALMGEHPFLQLLAQAFEADDPATARVRAGVIVTLLISGALAPGANRAADLDPSDGAIAAELERLSVEVASGTR